MSIYEFDIEESYMDRFFKPIKNKINIIELLMNSIKYMLINPRVPKESAAGKIIISADKMSRIFFIKPDKYFSVTFPFHIRKNETYFFDFKNKMDIDSRVISEILSLINESSFYSGCSIDFADKISAYQEDSGNEDYWNLLRDMMIMEDGYLRYDYDYDNYIKFNKSDIHPLNHFDVFYSSNATFKLGIRRKINHDDFKDLLDIKTKCKFVDYK